MTTCSPTRLKSRYSITGTETEKKRWPRPWGKLRCEGAHVGAKYDELQETPPGLGAHRRTQTLPATKRNQHRKSATPRSPRCQVLHIRVKPFITSNRESARLVSRHVLAIQSADLLLASQEVPRLSRWRSFCGSFGLGARVFETKTALLLTRSWASPYDQTSTSRTDSPLELLLANLAELKRPRGTPHIHCHSAKHCCLIH